MIETDVAIVICSRGREACLARLLRDLEHHFAPALEAEGMTCSIWVYAQGYSAAYLDRLPRGIGGAAPRLVVIPSERPHGRIGDVVETAIRAVHERSSYRLAMLMDDDSVYEPHPAVDANLRAAARRFIDRGDRAYSIKLGPGDRLEYGPFVDLAGPIMPFKEKMLWVGREVLEEVLSVPRFAELSIGEDAVIAALAWLPDPGRCFAVHGMGTFLHLAYEGSAGSGGHDIAGGYAELAKAEAGRPDGISPETKYDRALREGVTPHHVLPTTFVGEGHPHYAFNGIRPEVIRSIRASGRASWR